jgi:hypothetical protein
MIDVPSGRRCDSLLTYDASPVLIQPKADQFPSTRQGVRHFQTVTVFEVALPCRVERVAIATDLRVSQNWDVGRFA